MEVRARFLEDLLPDDPGHVGVLLDNVPEYLFLLGGAALAGRVVVGINPTRRGEELARDIRHADCQAVITDRCLRGRCSTGLDLGPATERLLIADTPEHDAALARFRGPDAPAIRAEPAPEDLLVLIFTSGSTGAPKAVRLTQGRAARAATGPMGFGPDDVLYCSMPVFHGNALMSMVFPSLASGASLVFKRKFSASGFLPDIRRYHCTFTSTIGRALAYILATPETDRGPRPRSEVHAVAGGLHRRHEGVPAPVRSAGVRRVRLQRERHRDDAQPGPAARGAGRARPGPRHRGDRSEPPSRSARRRASTPTGRLVNADEAIGELVGRNALDRFEGYYNNDAATLERTRSGWYWSGDLAYRDADGVFYFAGRNADWIRVDGENFAAAPVERVIQRFEGVAGVAVFGVPDDHTADDQTMAVIEMAEGADFDPVAFDAFLDDQRDLGTKWSPRYVRVVDALPVTATNKIDKAPLRRARWVATGEDPVYWRPERRQPLRRLSDEDRAEIVRRFEANGRADVLNR